MYERPSGYSREICWNRPTLTQARQIRLSNQPVGTLQDMLASPDGQWNNCLVTSTLPAAWADVVFELWGRTGASHRRLASAVSALRTPVGTPAAATLIQVAGRPCDRYTLRARSTGAELVGAELSLMCWGSDVLLPFEPQRVRVADGAAFTTSVAVARPAVVRTVYGTLTPAAPGLTFIMLFDAAALPPVGAPGVASIAVTPGATWSWNPALGDPFSTGLVIATSTTFDVFGASAATTTATAYID